MSDNAFIPNLVHVNGYPANVEEVEFTTSYGTMCQVRGTLKQKPSDQYGYAIEAPVGEMGQALLNAAEANRGFSALVRLVAVPGKGEKKPWVKMLVHELVGK